VQVGLVRLNLSYGGLGLEIQPVSLLAHQF
jgi:hypothetical protein